MLSYVGQGAIPLSEGGRNSARHLRPGGESACRSVPPGVGIMLSRMRQVSILLSRGLVDMSTHGHMMVSPAVGQNHIEKEPLKQCLKNTWRQVQKMHHCFSFRAPRMRSVGVGEVETLSLSWVHLQMGRGEGSQAYAAKAACFGLRGGGLEWWALEASSHSSTRFQFF